MFARPGGLPRNAIKSSSKRILEKIMRGYLPIFLCGAHLLITAACTEAPKPEKAKHLDDVKGDEEGKKGLGGKKGTLGPVPSGPVAKVGGKEISNEAFHAIYDLKVQKYKERNREMPSTADRRHRKSITDRLVYQEILRQETASRGIDYDPKDLEERETAQKKGVKDWPSHLKRRGETEESLREMYIAETSGASPPGGGQAPRCDLGRDRRRVREGQGQLQEGQRAHRRFPHPRSRRPRSPAGGGPKKSPPRNRRKSGKTRRRPRSRKCTAWRPSPGPTSRN